MPLYKKTLSLFPSATKPWEFTCKKYWGCERIFIFFRGAGHQILPNPNPPKFVILIQVALMLLVGVILFVAEKKRKLAKTALGDQYTIAPKESFQQRL